MKKAAIYHFTHKSNKRPIVHQKTIQQLKDFAKSLGFAETEIFCDYSLLRCEHPQFDRFLLSCENYDALIVKDFYHISKNTMQCMKIMKGLRDKGIQIHTMENGSFAFQEADFEKPFRVATYCCKLGPLNTKHEILQLKNDIFKLFADKKTQWTVVDQYFDESEHQNNGEQKQLIELIKNKDKYDLLLVHNLNDVHWRTANFCKIREQLQLDIYSLQDGFLKYNKEMIL